MRAFGAFFRRAATLAAFLARPHPLGRNKWFGNRFGTFRTPNGVVTGIWALQRPTTRHWGSGDVLPNIKKVWGKVDVLFGKQDQVDGLTVDNDPSVKPSIVADWRHLPFRDGQFGIGYWDPPYLGRIGDDGDVHYNTLQPCLNEICRVCRTVFILSPLVYTCPKGFKRVAMIAITMGPNRVTRSLQGFTRQESLPEADAPVMRSDAPADGAHAMVEQRSRPVGVILSDVQCESVEWLWTGRVPRGKMTLLEGDPDEGKSTVAFDLAARVSTGTAMPLTTTMTKPAGVVILSAEDALGDTIRPRLEAAGADLDRILGFRFEELPTIPEGLTVIEQAIKRVEAALVIVDPLVAFFGRTVNAYRDHDVRRALTPLVALAERTGAAVLAVRHLNKARMARAKYRGSGSIGIIGAARSALLVGRDPDDPNRRVIAPVKQNLSVATPAVAFSLVPAGSTARVEWLGETAHTAEGLLAHPAPEADRAALTDAMEFLRVALADGERPASDVLTEATTLGIAEMTLRRARKALQVNVRRQGFGKDGRFLLALPSNGSGAAHGAGQSNSNGNGNGFDHDQLAVPSGFSIT